MQGTSGVVPSVHGTQPDGQRKKCRGTCSTRGLRRSGTAVVDGVLQPMSPRSSLREKSTPPTFRTRTQHHRGTSSFTVSWTGRGNWLTTALSLRSACASGSIATQKPETLRRHLFLLYCKKKLLLRAAETCRTGPFSRALRTLEMTLESDEEFSSWDQVQSHLRLVCWRWRLKVLGLSLCTLRPVLEEF